jgi:hypothetical protein
VYRCNVRYRFGFVTGTKKVPKVSIPSTTTFNIVSLFSFCIRAVKTKNGFIIIRIRKSLSAYRYIKTPYQKKAGPEKVEGSVEWNESEWYYWIG